MYDVIIIGAGVSGSAAARELSRYDLKVGVLEKECRHLIRRFITFNTLHRPFITLKWAESADHFIDINQKSIKDLFAEDADRFNKFSVLASIVMRLRL